MELVLAGLSVLVGAAGATWAVVREQSLMRQLERVTAILKDTPVEALEPRKDLEYLRDHLSRRINRRYRAPRERFRLFMGWYLTLAGVGTLVWTFLLVAMQWVSQASPSPEAVPFAVAATVVLAIIAFALGRTTLRRRENARLDWVVGASEGGDSRRSAAPGI